MSREMSEEAIFHTEQRKQSMQFKHHSFIYELVKTWHLLNFKRQLDTQFFLEYSLVNALSPKRISTL